MTVRLTSPAQSVLPGMELYAPEPIHWMPPPCIPPTTAMIAEDTEGLLHPNFAVLPCPASRLRRGDLVVEPVLGEVRVIHVAAHGYDNLRHEPTCQVHWASDDGMGTAAHLYHADTRLLVRVPAPDDLRLVQHAIDCAHRDRYEIDTYTARLIAAHLQRGPGSALYAFAVTNVITDRLYAELDEIHPAPMDELNRWIHALANHCLNRTDHRREVQHPCGPLPGGLAAR